ncbi:uncharacterized protein LOC131160518 [Malania oleifera]|uniref:uncharacterized protein LOC131160518 n=1 Tax=Malania oleifera TaxID=397392 RepID=UPI0025ADE648|nr:uncharacterized protein LOC131160518 [Malania oleifera]
MDSANSGSIQSSSGGDEEYDSRAESISAFLIPTAHVGAIPNPPSQPLPHHHSAVFDPPPLPNYFDPLSRSPPLPNPNSLLNLEPVWSKPLRSDPNCTEIGGVMVSSSPGPPFPTAQGQQPRAPFLNSSPSIGYPQVPENAARGPGSGPPPADQTNPVRNPKKRSRASRRAPTTVLTTDTTNFRAMVQEFTGIPAPPFTSSPFPRSRLDLFGAPSSMRSGPLDGATLTPSYLLRPFAQKLQTQTLPFVSSSSSPSSLVDAIVSTTAANITSSNTTPLGFQMPSDLGILKQPQNLSNLLNMQNPIFTFQSFLQNPPKYPLPNTGSKSQPSLDFGSNDNSQLKMGNVLEDFGLGHGLGGLGPNLVSPPDGPPSSRGGDNNTPSWGDGTGANVNGSYGNSSPRASNGKVNFAAASSDFHGEKPPENNAVARSEGMVESWICSSD